MWGCNVASSINHTPPDFPSDRVGEERPDTEEDDDDDEDDGDEEDEEDEGEEG